MKKLVMICIVLLLATGVASAKEKPVMETGSKDFLEFTVSLSKSTYIEGEPVIATFALKNNSSTDQRLAEPTTSYGIVKYGIEMISGIYPMPKRTFGSQPGPPDDYGWVFRKGEARSIQVDLLSNYNGFLPVGRFCAKVTYSGVDTIEGIWHGSIEVSDLVFSVVPATGIEESASRIFRASVLQVLRGYEAEEAAKAAAALHDLADPAKGGRFAQYAGYWEAMAYMKAGNSEKEIEVLMQYSEKHSDVPAYGTNAPRYIGDILYCQKNYAKARKMFEKLPDGFERQDWLKRCDKRLSESSSNP